MIPAEWRRKNSIFRKTAAIFVIVALVPVAFLGYRSHHVYSDQLTQWVEGGEISRYEADYQAHEIEEQAIFYSVGGLIIALVVGYFFSRTTGRASAPAPQLIQAGGNRRIGSGGWRTRSITR